MEDAWNWLKEEYFFATFIIFVGAVIYAASIIFKDNDESSFDSIENTEFDDWNNNFEKQRREIYKLRALKQIRITLNVIASILIIYALIDLWKYFLG